MSKTILFSNLKGGVGKTTSTVSTAACLARLGFKCLIIDLDPQGNASQTLGLSESSFTISDILINGDGIKALPISENLVAIPCNFFFARFETEAKDRLRREEILKSALEPIKGRCDFILIDCPPSLGLATVNAYACADLIVIPMEAQRFAVEGLNKVLELIQAIKSELNPLLDFGGILFTRHRKNVILNKDILNEMREKYPNTFDAIIRENVALREAPHENKTILDYDPESNGSKDYMKFSNELLNRMGYEQEVV
ncbi:MAG: ParA family protein [Cyclobacteriaceae bacterium]